jgi:two-component system chemotaxis response regulator CheY
MYCENPAILVVDDVPQFREIIREMLLELGHTNVVEAADGAEALEKANSQDFALVISDYMMTPKNGIDLLMGLRGNPKLQKTPFIMVSAIDEMDIVQQAILLGATSYLPRPISFATLSRRVSDVIK